MHIFSTNYKFFCSETDTMQLPSVVPMQPIELGCSTEHV